MIQRVIYARIKCQPLIAIATISRRVCVMSRGASTPRRFLSQRMNSLIDATILDEAPLRTRPIKPDQRYRISRTEPISIKYRSIEAMIFRRVRFSSVPSRSALEDITSLGEKTPRSLARLYVISSITHRKCERKVRQAANSANRAFPVLRNSLRTYASVKDRYVSSKQVHRVHAKDFLRKRSENEAASLSLFLLALT